MPSGQSSMICSHNQHQNQFCLSAALTASAASYHIQRVQGTLSSRQADQKSSLSGPLRRGRWIFVARRPLVRQILCQQFVNEGGEVSWFWM